MLNCDAIFQGLQVKIKKIHGIYPAKLNFLIEDIKKLTETE